MNKISKMIKCRALFLQSVTYLNGSNIDLDEKLVLLLESFLENYFEGNEAYFNLIYYFDTDEEGNLQLTEDPNWLDELKTYLDYFKNGDNEKVKKLYDDIGPEDVKRISILAEQFINYILLVNDMNKTRIKN